LDDFEAIVAGSEDSWLRRLSPVVNGVIVQWLRVHFRFRLSNGGTIDPSRSTLERILERIPTPPTSTDQYPPFPVPVLPLDQWVITEDKRQSVVTEEDFVAAEICREHKVLAEGKGTITEEKLLNAVKIGEKFGETTAAAIEEIMNLLPSNPIAPSPVTVVPIIDVTTTPAKMYAPSLDPAEFAFISGNTVTKIEIARAYAEEEINGWVYWYDVCGRQIQYWQREITALEESEKKVKESRENGMKFLQLLMENKKQVEISKERIDEAKRQSSVAARHLARNMQSPKPTIPPPHNTPITQSLYVSDRGISNDSDQSSAINTISTQSERLNALLGDGGSNSPILHGVNDLIGAYGMDLLPPLDIRSSSDDDNKSKNNSDQEMKDVPIREVDAGDRDGEEIQG